MTKNIVSIHSELDAGSGETENIIEQIGEVIPVFETITADGEPLVAVFIVGDVDGEKMVEAVRNVINNNGFDSGSVDLEIAEVTEDDPDYEKPPWFEQRVNLAGDDPEVPLWMVEAISWKTQDGAESGVLIDGDKLAEVKSALSNDINVLMCVQSTSAGGGGQCKGVRVDFAQSCCGPEDDVRVLFQRIGQELGIEWLEVKLTDYEERVSSFS